MQVSRDHCVAAFLFAFVATTACAFAEQPKEDTPPKKDPPAEASKIDPTLLSKKLDQAAHPPPPELPRAEVVQAVAPPAPHIPEFSVKALVQVEGKPTSALIEIDGKNPKFVTEGTELSVHGGEKQVLTIKIKKVSPDGVEIELVQLKQTIHVK